MVEGCCAEGAGSQEEEAALAVGPDVEGGWVAPEAWEGGETANGEMNTSEGSEGASARAFRLRRVEVSPLENHLKGTSCPEPGKIYPQAITAGAGM